MNLGTNPLQTRAHLAASLADIFHPLESCFVDGDAGLHLGETGAHFPPRVAALEGFSRVLWGLAPLLAGGGISPMSAHMLHGLAHGTDPDHPGFWGTGGDRDQRQVEMAAIALSLLIAPSTFWEGLNPASQANLVRWLNNINQVSLPPTNWEFFRVLVNIALRRLGQPHDEQRLYESLALIEGLYRVDGWYIDETNYDLYNPFAFHFYGLVYARLMDREDPERCQRFRQRAREFALQFLPWFAGDGTMVPHGRSLCYRFAAVSFFSACAFAGEEVIPWGALKGVVLRHLRWWYQQPIFDRSGILTIGYRYPNLVMAEQYNSPGSPYWALKTFLVLALPDSHPFWSSVELPLPVQPAQKELAVPHLLACREGTGESEHVWLLAAGQYPCWESVHSAAKYAKFAYSSRFGFCVSHGSFDLTKTGCDSMIVFSEGDGYWRERRHSQQRSSCADWVHSRWHPWPDVEIDSWVVAMGSWHVRLHHIQSARRLECVEGGFSLPDHHGLDALAPAAIERPAVYEPAGQAIIVRHPWAWGAITCLSVPPSTRQAEILKPEPNLNVLHPRVLIPALRGWIEPGTTLLACAVAAGMDGAPDIWASLPSLELEGKAAAIVQNRGRKVRISFD